MRRWHSRALRKQIRRKTLAIFRFESCFFRMSGVADSNRPIDWHCASSTSASGLPYIKSVDANLILPDTLAPKVPDWKIWVGRMSDLDRYSFYDFLQKTPIWLYFRAISQLRACRPIPEAEVRELCHKARELLIEEGNVVTVTAPVTVRLHEFAQVTGRYWRIYADMWWYSWSISWSHGAIQSWWWCARYKLLIHG